MKNTLVFTPNFLKCGENGYLTGFHKEFHDCEAYYVTSREISSCAKNVIGVCCENASKISKRGVRLIYFDKSNGEISIPDVGDDYVRIVYDYDSFWSSTEAESSDGAYGVHFQFLMNKIRESETCQSQNGKTSLIGLLSCLIGGILNLVKYTQSITFWCVTLAHFWEDLSYLKCILDDVEKRSRLTKPKIWNFATAKAVDFLLGFVVMKLLFENEDITTEFISNASKEAISSFKDILSYLMGSPIGLKLNHSFNKSLGTFFFYHISLWRIFLKTIEPFIRDYFLKIFASIGALGLSYQVSMLSDMISIATFHVYCIYVYAARLFYFQIKALISLWRLFIGRKFNPLRQKVDSYQYNQNQLFIGTLGFTVLLFLLPTTTLYYTVFTIFRLGIIAVARSLSKLRKLLQCLPVFVVFLWLWKSPYLAGPVCIKHKNDGNDSYFEVNLKLLPLGVSIKKMSLNGASSISAQCNNSVDIFHNVFTGVLI